MLDVESSCGCINANQWPDGPDDGNFFLIQYYQMFDEAVLYSEEQLSPCTFEYVTDDIDKVFASTTVEWVHCSHVTGIAFVFHANCIKDQIYPCNGIQFCSLA